MKRFTAIAATTLLVVSMTACAQGDIKTDDDISKEGTASEETIAPETPKSEDINPEETKPETTKPEEVKPEETSPSDNNESQTESTDAEKLDDIMNELLKGLKIDIKTGNTEVTADKFSWYFGIEAIEGAEGLASESMIGSIAHSICILRLPEGSDAGKIADSVKENIDPRKWICVEAEKTIVKQKDNIIVLIMTFEDVADAVAANFDSIYN